MKLERVTLVAISSIKIDETIEALQKSMKALEYAEILLISHERPLNLPVGINFKACRRLNSIDAYNWFMVFDLVKYIKTDFALVIQHDGYVLRPECWTDDFLNYDYIGAPWPPGVFFDNEGSEVRVGNGGFSLRSQKLLNIFNELQLPFDDDVTSFPSEDAVICQRYRGALTLAGINFAPVAIASVFSRELTCPDSELETFGFHCHPTAPEIKSKLIKQRIIIAIKSAIKRVIPRFIINKLKAVFLENVRVTHR